MKPPRTPTLVLAALLLLPARGAAQAGQAQVIPRGTVSVQVAGHYASYRERFGGALGAGVGGPLSATRFPSLLPLQTELNRFYGATAGPTPFTATPENLLLGSLRLDLAADAREVPLTVEAGIRRGLSARVVVPFERRGTSVLASLLEGGTLGANPDTLGNRTRFGRVAGFAALGASRFLPTSTSAAGRAIQERLLAATADTAILPVSALTTGGLDTLLMGEDFGLVPLRTNRNSWRLGDVEVGLRYQLSDPFPGPEVPDSAGGIRAAVGLSARLPTGASRNPANLLELPYAGGHAGVAVELDGDAALSRRWWVGGGARVEYLLGADGERRVFTEGQPFPPASTLTTVTLKPGVRARVEVTPRYRLTREIAFAGRYAMHRAGATTVTGDGGVFLGGFETTEGWTSHLLGLGASYTALGAHRAGDAAFPFEVGVMVQRALVGGDAAPKASVLTLSGRLYHTFRRRPRPAPAESPADTTAAPAAPAPAPPTTTRPPTTTPPPTLRTPGA